MTDFFAYIKDYVDNRLSAEDRVAFEAEMAINTELRQAVDDYDVADMVLDGLLETELRSVVESVHTYESSVPATEDTRPKWRYLVAVSMVILLALTTGLLWRMTSSETTAKLDYASNFVPAVKPNEKGTTSKDSIQVAFGRYSIDTSYTVTTLSKINTLESQYWLAEIAADRGRWAEVDILMPSIDSLSTIKRDRAVYILAYTYHKTNQSALADSLLSVYQNLIDPYYLEQLSTTKE